MLINPVALIFETVDLKSALKSLEISYQISFLKMACSGIANIQCCLFLTPLTNTLKYIMLFTSSKSPKIGPKYKDPPPSPRLEFKLKCHLNSLFKKNYHCKKKYTNLPY